VCRCRSIGNNKLFEQNNKLLNMAMQVASQPFMAARQPEPEPDIMDIDIDMDVDIEPLEGEDDLEVLGLSLR
jgi:hypothetical protein